MVHGSHYNTFVPFICQQEKQSWVKGFVGNSPINITRKFTGTPTEYDNLYIKNIMKIYW